MNDQKLLFILCVQTLAIIRDIKTTHAQAHYIVGAACQLTNSDVLDRVKETEGDMAVAAITFIAEQCT